MDKTLYVVSGFMRTGTSMMMKSLEAGGLTASYHQSREIMKSRYADEQYDPNIGGLYELHRMQYQNPNFPNDYTGKLIKALNMSVPRMAVMPDGIRVVFMRRNSEEIRQSYSAFFNTQLTGIETLDERMEDVIERIKNRKDVLSLDVFQYKEIINNPLKHFEILKSHHWPINPDLCSSIVDPKYYRFRLENLTIGII